MNYKLIAKTLGLVLCIIALAMIPALVVSLIYKGTDTKAFVISIIVTFACGIILRLFKPTRHDIYTRDGLAIVAFSWILVSLFGALPVFISGTADTYISSFFDSS